MAIQNKNSALFEQTLHSRQKLWFVTGKGGVGKTSIAAALGMYCAERGQRTLLVETHGLTHLGQLLKVGASGYQAQYVRDNLSLVQINPEDALEEYLIQQLKFRFVYNAFFNNRYVRHFLNAAPGLAELLTIGKIWYLVAGEKDKDKYDRVIVDAPATGHGLSLLQIAQIVVDAVRVGPLRTKAEVILKFLRDEEQCRIWLVTLAEEMPVNEAIEMAKNLTENTSLSLAPIIVNSLWPQILSDKSNQEVEKKLGDSDLLQTYQKRFDLSRYYLKKLATDLKEFSSIELPLIYQTADPLLIAQSLKESLRAKVE